MALEYYTEGMREDLGKWSGATLYFRGRAASRVRRPSTLEAKSRVCWPRGPARSRAITAVP